MLLKLCTVLCAMYAFAVFLRGHISLMLTSNMKRREKDRRSFLASYGF